MVQELEQANKGLEMYRNELGATTLNLYITNEDLESTTADLHNTNKELVTALGALETQEQLNSKLRHALALEKEKARQADDAQAKLEQLKKHWSALFNVVSDDETKQ